MNKRNHKEYSVFQALSDIDASPHAALFMTLCMEYRLQPASASFHDFEILLVDGDCPVRFSSGQVFLDSSDQL
jgi:hypothetical protein